MLHKIDLNLKAITFVSDNKTKLIYLHLMIQIFINFINSSYRWDLGSFKASFCWVEWHGSVTWLFFFHMWLQILDAEPLTMFVTIQSFKNFNFSSFQFKNNLFSHKLNVTTFLLRVFNLYGQCLHVHSWKYSIHNSWNKDVSQINFNNDISPAKISWKY